MPPAGLSPEIEDQFSRGLWGQPTSTLFWCENKYEVTRYIAEFWNTITNLVMILLPFAGMYEVSKQNFEKRFHYCFISLCIVGIGSWLFHMTLYYEMQLLDELPMIWTSFLYLYCMLHTKSPKNSLNAKHGIGFLSICVAFTVLYISWKNILFFQVFFLVLVLIIAVLDVHLMRTQYDEKSVKLFCLGIFLYALGGVVWLTDVHLCDQLRSLRANVIPRFISPFTQMHGWWHILAGYGTYMHLLFCIFQRETFLKRKPEFVFKFPVGLSLELKKKQP